MVVEPRAFHQTQPTTRGHGEVGAQFDRPCIVENIANTATQQYLPTASLDLVRVWGRHSLGGL